MEILIIIAVLAVFVWWFFLKEPTVETKAPYKVETPVPAQDVAPQPLAVDGAGTVTPAWHTAPAEGSALAENVLDVNHDGKVNLEDVKEIVKKTRKPRAPKAEAKAEKPAAKKAAPKKAAAMKAKPKTPRSKKA